MRRWFLLALVGSLQAQPLPPVAVGSGPGQPTWVVQRSFAPPPRGGFYAFEDQNNAGKWRDTGFNCGTMDGTPGVEQGDCDTFLTVDGKPVTVSVSGRWQGGEPGVLPWPPDLMWVGSPINRFAGFGATQVPCPPSVPGTPAYCIRVNEGFTPVYQ